MTDQGRAVEAGANNTNAAPLASTLDALRAALGDDSVRVGAQIGERAMTDWTRHDPTRPAALLLPRTTG